MAQLKWPSKDPDDILDYLADWTDWVPAGDRITEVEWIVPEQLTVIDQAFTDTTTTVWLTGGLAGEVYFIVCRVKTLNERQKDRTIRLPVKDA